MNVLHCLVSDIRKSGLVLQISMYLHLNLRNEPVFRASERSQTLKMKHFAEMVN